MQGPGAPWTHPALNTIPHPAARRKCETGIDSVVVARDRRRIAVAEGADRQQRSVRLLIDRFEGQVGGAVARDDKALVGRANGVGPKLAQRIVTELKDKPITDGPVAAFHASIPSHEPAKPSAAGEAVAGLMGLGIAEPVARRAVEQSALRLGEDADVSALIKAALQEIGR